MPYLVPRQVTERFEILPGVGWREAGVVAAAAFLAGLFLLLPLPVPARFLLASPFAAAGVAAVLKLDGTLSVLDYAVRAWRWAQAPRRYRLRATEED